jgi:hypothetical protein
MRSEAGRSFATNGLHTSAYSLQGDLPGYCHQDMYSCLPIRLQRIGPRAGTFEALVFGSPAFASTPSATQSWAEGFLPTLKCIKYGACNRAAT